MHPSNFIRCPHCDTPRAAQPFGSEPLDLVGSETCSDCKRSYLEETASTLLAGLASRLEAGNRARCSMMESKHEVLPAGVILRTTLKVEALRRGKRRLCKLNFDYDRSTLCVRPAINTEAELASIVECDFPIDDIQLEAIFHSISKALSLPRDDRQQQVGGEVRFRQVLANIELAFQQPCQHIPRCSDF